MKLYGAVCSSPWGWIGVAGRQGALWAACLPQNTVEEARHCLERQTGESLAWEEGEQPGWLRDGVLWLEGYLAGSQEPFTGAVDLSVLSPFGREVLEGVRRIPLGQVWNYQELACLIGRPGGARAVGGALRANPLPFWIPCHRVIRKNGQVGGYSGVQDHPLKSWLLRHEGILLL